jgi:hypothetical protein
MSSQMPPKIGVVKSLEDPNKKNRVQVIFPDEGFEVWAEMMFLKFSKDSHSVSFPHVSDTVVVLFPVGFVPVILGYVHGKNVIPDPLALTKDNKKEGFKTRSEITCDITNEPNKAKITLTAKDGTVFLYDQENSTIGINDKDKKTAILMDIKNGKMLVQAKEITFQGEKDTIILKEGESLTFKTAGKFVVEANDVQITAQSSVKISGGNINVEGSGNTVIKGSSVAIN